MKANVAELLAKAQKPGEDAMRLHPLYRGKLEVTPQCAIRSRDDFSIWYTPGVAAPCRDIAQHPEKVFAHGNKANFIAIVSDGTRVLGLGDIGHERFLRRNAEVSETGDDHVYPNTDTFGRINCGRAGLTLRALSG